MVLVGRVRVLLIVAVVLAATPGWRASLADVVRPNRSTDALVADGRTETARSDGGFAALGSDVGSDEVATSGTGEGASGAGLSEAELGVDGTGAPGADGGVAGPADGTVPTTVAPTTEAASAGSPPGGAVPPPPPPPGPTAGPPPGGRAHGGSGAPPRPTSTTTSTTAPPGPGPTTTTTRTSCPSGAVDWSVSYEGREDRSSTPSRWEIRVFGTITNNTSGTVRIDSIVTGIEHWTDPDRSTVTDVRSTPEKAVLRPGESTSYTSEVTSLASHRTPAMKQTTIGRSWEDGAVRSACNKP